MEYSAGLDISMEETHVCIMTGDGVVILDLRAPSTPAGIHHHARYAQTRHRVQAGLAERHLARAEVEPSSRAERRPREGVDDGVNTVAYCHFG